ncbi:MAG: hypothetical protein A2992_06695 [Elusimicrobia bacterium RIFCSPLOWO2_01_FULL_59_12]|nr:MAG: hypothetical protein A2992_06695 [Elusimicrobia bacterium RIFCSPLOWO2_01_FULL_59_12]
MALQAPHQQISVQSDKESFLVRLFDTLYARYRERMAYVRMYEELVMSNGGTFVNDHIAFRTLAAEKPALGIFMISRIFEALGYSSAACYEFPDKHFSSIHYQHPNPQFPKLFITQLKTWELSQRARALLQKSLKTHLPHLSDANIASLYNLDKASQAERTRLLRLMVRYFEELPWELPQKKDVQELDQESQFAAWVLVNGYDVNHFTASINSHGADALADIDKTVAAMRRAGIPMKPEIEGEPGTQLRQSSTEAVVIPVPVRDGVRTAEIPWTYAYFEIAERPLMKNPMTGKMERFEGFLGGQAANLFEMTKLKH